MNRPKLLVTFLLAAIRKRSARVILMTVLGGVLVAAIFLLAACANAPTQPPAEEAAPAVPSPSEALNIETESAEVVEPADEPAPATVEPASAAVSEPTPTDDEVREVRAGLEASNPSGFEIASGDVQLVEFFAFW
jgi:outer membrane biosynthesis protein TonB